ncbi:MAG: VCBS repeat-containing protein [Planctomycetaceae bacterium]|nr:VCBS repeat-containing protein [Planctomycetaceae bacterium]
MSEWTDPDCCRRGSQSDLRRSGRHSIVAGTVSVVLIAAAVTGGCNRSSEPAAPSAPVSSATVSSEPPEFVRVFCGNCHLTPSPDTFPRDAWYAEVRRGFNFYTDSQRTDLKVPKFNDVVAWYRSAAPEHLPAPESPGRPEPDPQFQVQAIPSRSPTDPMVSSVLFLKQSNRAVSRLLLTDMRSGQVFEFDPRDLGAGKLLLQASHPASVTVFRPNSAEGRSLLVSDLGSELPADHDKGKLSWISPAEPASVTTLLQEVGRVAHADSADFDQDGDTDIVMAEFGWQKTGRILLLEHTGSGPRQTDDHTSADYAMHVLDSRHGGIHVPVGDLNADGLPDFAALISQEFEVVEAFLSNGDLTFRKESILPAHDPAFGSSGIELVDIDGDGDLDVLYTNGDTLDSMLLKHYHGVHLLINEGRFPFTARKILSLPGASDASAVDLDGDGDLDIVVTAFLPGQLHSQLAEPDYVTLCWLEQTDDADFQPHVLERSLNGHVSVTVGDFNGDSAADIAVGNFSGQDWGKIWWNRMKSIDSETLLR